VCAEIGKCIARKAVRKDTPIMCKYCDIPLCIGVFRGTALKRNILGTSKCYEFLGQADYHVSHAVCVVFVKQTVCTI
jgi:hypothetical protein